MNRYNDKTDDYRGAAGQMKILIVDSNSIFVEGLKNLLNAEGVEDIDSVSGGITALDRIRISKPDVVLMDTRMKPISGFDTARLMLWEYPDEKIVMLSESGSESELQKSKMCGASGFLRKDINAGTLLKMLNRLRAD